MSTGADGHARVRMLTCTRTRAARAAGVSSGSTGTARCASTGPVSYASSTKCTVAPLNATPLARTACGREVTLTYSPSVLLHCDGSGL